MSDEDLKVPAAGVPPAGISPTGVSRRDALRTLGLAAGGVAAAVSAAACAPDTAAHTAAHTHEAAAGTAGAAAAPAAPKTPFFTPHERETVTVLVDYVIPRDARSGSATDAGVPAWMDAFLADADTEDPFRLAIRGGLAWMDAESTRRAGTTFVRATDPMRRAILDDIAYPKRARPAMSQGAAFFSRFRDFTASGFYSSKMGQEDLRYMGNVAVPVWNGCPPEALASLGVSYDVMATRVPIQGSGKQA